MFATRVTRSVLWVAITLIAIASLTSSASADPVTWAGNAQFNQVPSTDGAGQLQVNALPGTGGPTLQNSPNGFVFTDVQLVYTINAADRGKKVTLTYTILRPFNNAPAGPSSTNSVLNGTLNLPNIQGALVQSVTLRTELAFQGAASAAVVNVGPFAFNGGAVALAGNAKTPVNLGGGDALVQTFSVVFDFQNVPLNAAFGGNITIDLPGSAESFIEPVPEPATMLLLGTGLVGVAIRTRKKLNRGKSGQKSQ